MGKKDACLWMICADSFEAGRFSEDVEKKDDGYPEIVFRIEWYVAE